ncbi:MAG: thioesterase family protein, partial [Gordonia sp. (in: high G+C Gram-positive bacteria)]
MTHAFDEAITLTTVGTERNRVVRATTHPAYNNMVGPYGGITAAAVVKAITQHPDVLGDPLSMT